MKLLTISAIENLGLTTMNLEITLLYLEKVEAGDDHTCMIEGKLDAQWVV